MKQRLLIACVFTVVVGAAWAAWVGACDQNKKTSASAAVASNGECSAHGMKTSVASNGECSAHATKTSVASNGECSAHATKTSVASNGECSAHGMKTSVASNGDCSAHGMKTSVASNGDCSAHGMKGTKASVAGANCSAKSGAAATAKNGVMGDCFGSGMVTAMDATEHNDCDACSDMSACARQLMSNSAQTQVFPLKNGVMFVYTTDNATRVRTIQSAIARRTQRMMSLASAGDRAKLCPQCKTMRGAIASGKLTRETVNIEGGCLTLMTSSDPAMVTRLRGMASAQQTAARIKS